MNAPLVSQSCHQAKCRLSTEQEKTKAISRDIKTELQTVSVPENHNTPANGEVHAIVCNRMRSQEVYIQ
jgi:hypothetical protein